MTSFRLLLVAGALLLITGCSSVRGELVETGFAPLAEFEADPALAGAEVPLAARLTSEFSPPAGNLPRPEPVGLQGDATASFDFRARELYSGSIIEGTELFGQGKVLVTFVQPGCDITVDDGPTIAEIAEAHPEAIFVIVHSGADDTAYRAFAERAMLFQENMMHLSDTYGSLAARYSINAYPTTLLIDRDMQITAVTGVMDHESHRAAVEAVTTRSIAN